MDVASIFYSEDERINGMYVDDFGQVFKVWACGFVRNLITREGIPRIRGQELWELQRKVFSEHMGISDEKVQRYADGLELPPASILDKMGITAGKRRKLVSRYEEVDAAFLNPREVVGDN